MGKRKSQLAGKLDGGHEGRPGWREMISTPPTTGNEPVAELPNEETVVRRRRTANRDKPVRKTYLVPPSLIEQITLMAEEEQVGINDLVCFLLKTSLDLVEAGRLQIPTKPGRRRIGS